MSERRLPVEFTTADLASMLGRSTYSVWSLAKRGMIPASRFNGKGHYRISLITIQELWPEQWAGMVDDWIERTGWGQDK